MSVLLHERQGPIAILTFNRPESLNAINEDVLAALEAAATQLEGDAELRAVVLKGAGDRAFVAGADIGFMRTLTPVQAEGFAARGQAVLDRLSALPVPVLAAVHGFALGGGCEIAMACDIVIAGPKARFGQPEVTLGVVPGFGGSQRLVRRAGHAVALDLCLSGRMVGAEEALRIGLVSRIEDDAQQATLEAAQQISALAPVALSMCKRLILDHGDGGLTAGQSAERVAFGLCFSTEDQTEGMTAFLEKRKAAFTGR
ncbi:MAG: enoyl-CoA hydratase-related protein [Myxococcota bacterium]